MLEEVNLVSVLHEIPSSTGQSKFLEEKSNQNDQACRRNHIVPFFAQACAKVGIEIQNNGWQDIYQKLTLKCIRWRDYSCQQSKKNIHVQQSRQNSAGDNARHMINPETGYKYSKAFQERMSKTTGPKEGEMQSPFKIILKLDTHNGSDTGLGYVFNGNMMHHGHLQKNADEIQLHLWHHNKESTRLAVNAIKIHLGCG